VCKSISVAAIDPEDSDQGFWLAQIDNGVTMQQKIKAFDFDALYIAGLKRLSTSL